MRAMIAIVPVGYTRTDLTLRVTVDEREKRIGWYDNYDDAMYASSLIRQTLELLNIDVERTTDERAL